MVHIILEDSEFFYYVTVSSEALLLVTASVPLLLSRIRDTDLCLRRFNPVANILLWFGALAAIVRWLGLPLRPLTTCCHPSSSITVWRLAGAWKRNCSQLVSLPSYSVGVVRNAKSALSRAWIL